MLRQKKDAAKAADLDDTAAMAKPDRCYARSIRHFVIALLIKGYLLPWMGQCDVTKQAFLTRTSSVSARRAREARLSISPPIRARLSL